jgi:hypothetical protein
MRSLEVFDGWLEVRPPWPQAAFVTLLDLMQRVQTWIRRTPPLMMARIR